MTLIVSWLWQGLVIAWITAAAVRAMPRLNAETRHAIWWLALAAVLAIPLAQWLAAIGPDTPRAPDLMGSLDAAGAFVLPAFPDGVVAGAAAVWAIVATAGVLRIVRSCRTLGRLKRASTPFDRSREACLPLWVAARDGGHRSAELRSSDCVSGAYALGLRRPVIVVSRSVAEALTDESLDEIVMHEQAHLDRFDDWSQLLQLLICSLAGMHPAVRFLARRLDVDREAACDDRVVSRTGATRRYAYSLLTVAAASNPEAGGIAFAAGAPTATTTASALRVRVGRLLDPRRNRDARLARATSLVSVTALALTVVMSTQVAPVVVFLEAAIINGPASPFAPAIEVRRAPEPTPRANMNVAAGTLERRPHRTFRRLKRTVSDPPEAPAPQVVGTTPDAPPTAPLDSRIIAVNDKASISPVSLPSLQRAGIATPASAPWDAVTISTTSAADGVARAAVAAGARARSAGVSIGRFFGRASKAGASIF